LHVSTLQPASPFAATPLSTLASACPHASLNFAALRPGAKAVGPHNTPNNEQPPRLWHAAPRPCAAYSSAAPAAAHGHSHAMPPIPRTTIQRLDGIPRLSPAASQGYTVCSPSPARTWPLVKGAEDGAKSSLGLVMDLGTTPARPPITHQKSA